MRRRRRGPRSLGGVAGRPGNPAGDSRHAGPVPRHRPRSGTGGPSGRSTPTETSSTFARSGRGRPLVQIPAELQAAGTVPADSGIVARAHLDRARVPFWDAEAVHQSYLPGTNVLRTVARFGAHTATVVRRLGGTRSAAADRRWLAESRPLGERCAGLGAADVRALAARAPGTDRPQHRGDDRRRPRRLGLCLAARRGDRRDRPRGRRPPGRGPPGGRFPRGPRPRCRGPIRHHRGSDRRPLGPGRCRRLGRRGRRRRRHARPGRERPPGGAWPTIRRKRPASTSGTRSRPAPSPRALSRVRGPAGFDTGGRLRLRPRLGGGLGGPAVPASAPSSRPRAAHCCASPPSAAASGSPPRRTGPTTIPGPRRPPGAPGAWPPSASAAPPSS